MSLRNDGKRGMMFYIDPSKVDGLKDIAVEIRINGKLGVSAVVEKIVVDYLDKEYYSKKGKYYYLFKTR